MNECGKLFMHERNKANKDLEKKPFSLFCFSGTQGSGLPNCVFFAVLGLHYCKPLQPYIKS